MVLSWIYVLFGALGFVSALFFGLKAAVLAIVVHAVVRLGKRALKNNVMLGPGVCRGDSWGFGGPWDSRQRLGEELVEVLASGFRQRLGVFAA